MNVKSLVFLAALVTSFSGTLNADEPPVVVAEPQLPAEEQQLIVLLREMQAAFDKHYEAADKLPEGKEQWDYHVANYPDRTYIPRLLEFEQQHAGTRAGLMALRKVVHLCGSGLPYPGELPWFEVFRRLPAYFDREESVELIRYIDGNALDPKLEEPLRTLAKYPNANPVCHEYAELMLARWMLNIRNGREYRVRRLHELDAGDKEKYHPERQRLAEELAALPADDAHYTRWETEAVEILTAIVQRNSSLRRPGVKNVDPDWLIIEMDDAKSESMPRICDIAAGVLFKENHLRIGKIGPELQVKLVSGEDWSLATERGKVAIVMFSFTGCGPCESMYADLKTLHSEMADKVSILTIMCDDDKADTENAVSSGKLIWNVSHETGTAGPLPTLWGVKGFPTVYVFDKTGRVAAYGLRYEELNRKVRELNQIP